MPHHTKNAIRYNNKTMKNKQLAIILCLSVFFQLTSCKNHIKELNQNAFKQTAKVIGYLPSGRFNQGSKIEYCKLTHLNLAFANPDASGNLIMAPITNIVTQAKTANPNIKICISLAGGGNFSPERTKNWSNLIDIASKRPAFITKIVDYVLANNIDGVDVDLEWDHVTIGYSGFITELKTALDAHNKIITAALPNNTRFENITNEALQAFDFINIMSYDATGPWRPEKPGQHSSFQSSKAGIDFWKHTVKIPKDKLTLGVPFYGYNFGNNPVTSITYRQLVDSDVALADTDQSNSTYYNGIPTIEAKVELAKKEVGGIMIWELGQDSFDSYSLLSTIHNKYTALQVKTSGLCGNEP